MCKKNVNNKKGTNILMRYSYLFLRCSMTSSSSTPLGIRTLDPLIKSQLLYQLS